MLRHLPSVNRPDVLVSASTGDDAAVVRPAAGGALVLTTDFFTPIVDDAYDFGRIAAANALSDVYAMGGRPLWCLSIVAWPRDTLPLELLGEVLRGAADVVSQAGAAIVGGHSIDDPEPKFGLMVVGEVDPSLVTANSAARPGDVLVLTKPVGTGVIATAIKKGTAPEDVVKAAVACMTTLNAPAAEAAAAAGARAATDVTGFGLLGHLHRMLLASGCAAELDAASVPLLPGAAALAEAGNIPGGTRRNLDWLSGAVDFGAAGELTRLLLSDAQTSGGLLIAVAEARAGDLVRDLQKRGTPAAAVIGRVVAGPAGKIRVSSQDVHQASGRG